MSYILTQGIGTDIIFKHSLKQYKVMDKIPKSMCHPGPRIRFYDPNHGILLPPLIPFQ